MLPETSAASAAVASSQYDSGESDPPLARPSSQMTRTSAAMRRAVSVSPATSAIESALMLV